METQIAVALASYLPVLLRAGEGAADALGTEAGRLAAALWERLRDKILARPAAEEAVRDVAANPDDEDSLASLRLQLRKLLAEDEALKGDLATVFQRMSPTTTATDHSTAISQQAGDGGVNIVGPNTGNIRTSR